jgi:hypothetical protein
MWLLKKLGYKGLNMTELQPYLTGKKQGKVVGITFDFLSHLHSLMGFLADLSQYPIH